MSQLPFKAYGGEEPFVFISYAHKDSEKVFPIIEQLHNKGYRVWYDEGIDPGSEWPEEIALHIKNATVIILFVSPNSMDSHNVRREVTFSIDLRKLMLSVYLQPTEMSAGMSLQLGLNQAIHYYTYQTDKEFFDKLLPSMPTETLGAPVQLATQPEPVAVDISPAPAPVQSQQTHNVPNTIDASNMKTEVFQTVQPLSEFTSFGMVLPFVPKGKVTVSLKNGSEASCPLNCFVTPQNKGNFDGICVNKTINGDEQYFCGAPSNYYRFEEMASMEATPKEEYGRIQLLINLANGERRFFEDLPQFEIGGMFGRSFRRFPISEVSKITFDKNCTADDISDLALVTTMEGVSFYAPLGMLETMQFAVSMGGGGYSRYSGVKSSEAIIDFKKITSIEIDNELGGRNNSQYSLTYTMRSGLSEKLEPTDYYPPALSGINQYGCFFLPYKEIARIEIYAGGREGAPMPTPLPDIHWPKPEGTPVPFFGDGLATITDVANNIYTAPANAVFGIDGHVNCALYEGIATNLSTEPIFELFRVNNLTDLADLERIEISAGDDKYSGNYNMQIKDSSGFTISGIYNHSDQNAFPGFVFPNGARKGGVRIFALKSIDFDFYGDAPEVEQAVIYTKTGKAIGVPRGGVVLSAAGQTTFPGSCFELPTGNSIPIESLQRMMIYDQQEDDGIKQWIVFECEDFRGAFPMSADMIKDYRIFAASEFGLTNLQPGFDWFMLDMKCKENRGE